VVVVRWPVGEAALATLGFKCQFDAGFASFIRNRAARPESTTKLAIDRAKP
jgi:hypothetical protein